MSRRLLEVLLYLAAPFALFLTSPILAQGLGSDARGQLGLIQSIVSLAAAAGALGQPEVLLDDLRHGYGDMRSPSRAAFLGAVVACAVGALVALYLGVEPIVALAGLAFVPIINQTQLWRAIAVSQHQLMRPALVNATSAVLRTLVVVLLFALGWLTAASAIGAIQGALAVGSIVWMYGLARRWQSASPPRVVGEVRGSPIRRGLPVLVFTLLTTVTLRSDMVVLSVISSPDELGVYAGASALSMAVLSVSGAFKSRAQAAAFRADAPRAVSRELLVLLGFSVPGAIAAALLSPWIVALLLGPGYESASGLIRVLAFASVALMFLDVTHGLLAVLGARQIMVLVALVGAGTTVVSLVLLVQLHGAVGAAWASLLSYLVAAVFGLIVAFRALALESKVGGVRDGVRVG